MPDPRGAVESTPTPSKRPRTNRSRHANWSKPLRRWSRAIHRDLGYFCVGLTVIYAASGLAVNHIADWEPNFRQVHREHQLPLPLPVGEQQIAAAAAELTEQSSPAEETYRDSPSSLEVVFERTTLRIDLVTGQVIEEGQQPRFFLRLANWLHLNRGKPAWTVIADAYAVFLLVLAMTGLWMFPGRKGLWGRAGWIALSGAAVPTAYVLLSGGP